MNKHITISLFRVSTDSKYLDMVFDCPDDFYFTSLELEVRYQDVEDKVMKSNFYDLSNALSFADSKDKKHWTVRVPLDKLGIEVPAIYKGTIKAKEVVEEGEIADELCDHMICSDVNYAYKCMLNDLLGLDNLSDPCVSISDDAIRKYLVLYGHHAALSTGDDEVAERFFKLINNCFNICGSHCGCSCSKHKPQTNNCNCGK